MFVQLLVLEVIEEEVGGGRRLRHAFRSPLPPCNWRGFICGRDCKFSLFRAPERRLRLLSSSFFLIKMLTQVLAISISLVHTSSIEALRKLIFSNGFSPLFVVQTNSFPLSPFSPHPSVEIRSSLDTRCEGEVFVVYRSRTLCDKVNNELWIISPSRELRIDDDVTITSCALFIRKGKSVAFPEKEMPTKGGKGEGIMRNNRNFNDETRERSSNDFRLCRSFMCSGAEWQNDPCCSHA